MKNPADFKVLIACEESQTVCKAFRERGFMEFVKFADETRTPTAIENPVGIMSTKYRKPNFTYNPYDFDGETECKKTCIWSFGLPNLKPTQNLPKELRTTNIWKAKFDGKSIAWNSQECAKFRSKTPIGVAAAMAEQWGNELLDENDRLREVVESYGSN